MDEIEKLLSRRIETVYPSKIALEKKMRSRKLRLYQGFDPTSPNLHIGHLVGLLTLRDFQRLGHEVIFLIGDFTTRIGDPTGKDTARQLLTVDQIRKNAATYKKQVSPILKFTGKNPVKIKYNSTWNEKLSFAEVIQLAQHLTVQQLIERDMFQVRLKKNREIYLNEFIYPLIQGYDSVAMKVDLEIGGNDQLFNMMVGRKLVAQIQDREKFVVTTKLLTDNQGKKIGKSEGNAIDLINPPHQFYGQIMSLTDESIMPCLALITDLPDQELAKLQKEYNHTTNPLNLKKRLAFEVTKLLHGDKAAREAQREFENVFQRGSQPAKPTQISVDPGTTMIKALLNSAEFKSAGEIKRIIAQGGGTINEEKITDPNFKVKPGDQIRIGKHRFFKII